MPKKFWFLSITSLFFVSFVPFVVNSSLIP
jgi:hypothetical protein